MGMKCYLCNKGVMIGKQHRHHKGVAGGRWLKRAPTTVKRFIPNLHSSRITIDKTPKRVRLCTKCLRRAKEETKSKTTTSLVQNTVIATA